MKCTYLFFLCFNHGATGKVLHLYWPSFSPASISFIGINIVYMIELIMSFNYKKEGSLSS